MHSFHCTVYPAQYAESTGEWVWGGESIKTHACVLNQRQQIRLQNDEDLPAFWEITFLFYFYFFFAPPFAVFFSFFFLYVIVKIYYVFLSPSDSLFFPFIFFAARLLYECALMPASWLSAVAPHALQTLDYYYHHHRLAYTRGETVYLFLFFFFCFLATE